MAPVSGKQKGRQICHQARCVLYTAKYFVLDARPILSLFPRGHDFKGYVPLIPEVMGHPDS
jgi:hypothetical protein